MSGRYSEGGDWRSADRGICRGCDKDRKLYDVGSMDQLAWFCYDCIKKFGKRTLEAAANAALAARSAPKTRVRCLRCDAPLLPGISEWFMCRDCNDAYKERFGRNVKWQ